MQSMVTFLDNYKCVAIYSFQWKTQYFKVAFISHFTLYETQSETAFNL